MTKQHPGSLAIRANPMATIPVAAEVAPSAATVSTHALMENFRVVQHEVLPSESFGSSSITMHWPDYGSRSLM